MWKPLRLQTHANLPARPATAGIGEDAVDEALAAPSGFRFQVSGFRYQLEDRRLGELREDEELAQLQTGDDRTAAEVRQVGTCSGGRCV
jgi:hypothetical protein